MLEVFQRVLAGSGGVDQNGINEGSTQAVEDGRAQQESLNVFGLLPQHFFDQIVKHEMMAAGEGFYEAGGVLMSPHRDRGQLQAGDPTFGSTIQGGDVSRRKVQAHPPSEKLCGFVGGESQLGGAQL